MFPLSDPMWQRGVLVLRYEITKNHIASAEDTRSLVGGDVRRVAQAGVG